VNSFNYQTEKNVLYYEVLNFILTYKTGDSSCCNAALESSLKGAELLDWARKDAGIVFAADKAISPPDNF
jgi:hypothetical protein